MPKYTILTPRDLDAIAEAFVARPKDAPPLSKSGALNTIARTLVGGRADWGRIKNHEGDTFESQRAQAAASAAGSPAAHVSGLDDFVTRPSPRVADAGQLPDLIGVQYDSWLPSGIPDRTRASDTKLRIHATPLIDPKVVISACRARTLHDLCEGLGALDEARDLSICPIHVSNLSPGEISGRPLPMVFDETRMADFAKLRRTGLGELSFTHLPVLAFIEDAWSETLKAVDKQLSARVMRWRFNVSDAGEDIPDTAPRAVFLVQNEARFHDIVHRYMPFTREALASHD